MKKKLGYILITLGLLVLSVTAVSAHFNHCEYGCHPPTPTPTVTPSETPEPTPTDEPTATPSATPVPTEEPTSEPVPLTKAGAPQSAACPDLNVAPTILTFNRPTSNQVHVTWSETSPISNYLVEYGTSEFILPWNTFVYGSHEVTLSNVPDESIWVRVSTTANGCIGPHSVTIDP